ncbi:YbfB/YjiJ family MFS transporter [Polaromonas sp.]|uniref:YbfB/YjiJ family MFS transporter n=1 Tax=Polaromonas sp. TaxID=1869339 RepID=UPI0027308C0E|nr:YbfB/YjiJ family MFS transporter [Polaromonas sp.]MDP1740168.1 YbfB/YjiJ family MFS transporter [Polaromonas sp.]
MAGLLALATAMGIGRFAFTPLLPMMLSDGVVDLPSASWLASANYFGYLVGALLCTFQPWIWKRLGFLPPLVATVWLRGGLVATALLTLGMALQLPVAWPLLRFAAGVASALVFVYTSGWCLAQLSRLGAPALGGVMYAGPGAGIAISGLLASGMVALQWTAAAGWLIFGVLAALLTSIVWSTFSERDSRAGAVAGGPSANPAVREEAPAGRPQMLLLASAYGLAGFGYIITATFLPVIARQAMPGSGWIDFFWPLFGVGVVCGALLATRIPVAGDRRYLLAGAYVIQALGIGASLLSPTLAGFALGSMLLGLPFTAITFFAMQEVRRLRPAAAASYMGLLTALYGIGQIAGPPLVAWLLQRSRTLVEGFTLSLEIAAGALLAGALMYLWMARAYPVLLRQNLR